MLVEELQNIISPKFTKQVLFDIINKKSGLSEVEIQQIKIGTDAKKGDSYLSSVCRFIVEATGKNSVGTKEAISVPVIVKYLPQNIGRRKTYRSSDFFENEIIFYQKVWPVFQQFQDSKHIQNKFDNIPFVMSAHFDGSNDYIAMLDLSYEGYKSADRGAGLNYHHTVSILKLLARFHALSLAMKDQQPEVFERAATSLKESYCAEKYRGWYVPYQQKLIAVVRDAVEKELPPMYAEKFSKLVQDDLYGKVCKLCEVRGPLAVVTHGDVWVPNFLIKYNSGETDINHIIMIDFQFTRYTTLANDITFFFYTCVDPTLLETKWDDLVGEYHESLSDSLESLGCDKNRVTLEDVHSEIKKYNTFGICMGIEAAVMAQLGDDEITDLDAIQGTEAVPIEDIWMVQPFKEQEKRKRVANMIKLSVDKKFM